MHLFIKLSFFHHFWPKFRPRCWDIFSISGNTLMNHFFSIVIYCEKAKNVSVSFCGSDAPFHQISISHNYLLNFARRFWDIFSISGNTLMNHFFSIVLSCEKAKNGSARLCESDAPFHQIFNFSLLLAKFWTQILRYFLNFRKCAYESLPQHRNILRKSEKRVCEVLRIRCTFSSTFQFFIIFRRNLGPDFEKFSQFQEMPVWITSSAS